MTNFKEEILEQEKTVLNIFNVHIFPKGKTQQMWMHMSISMYIVYSDLTCI